MESTPRRARDVIRDLHRQQQEATIPDAHILMRRSMMDFGGYYDLNQLEVLGQGEHGTAYKLGSKVLKITDDRQEAEACFAIKGRRLRNVAMMYRVGAIRGGMTQQWAVLQEYLPVELTEEEKRIVNTIAIAVHGYAKARGAMPYLLNWRDRQTLIEFGAYVERHNRWFLGNELAEEILVDIVTALKALARAGVGYADMHAGNVRRDAGGTLKVFDLGVSFTRQDVEIPVIEHNIPCSGRLVRLIECLPD